MPSEETTESTFNRSTGNWLLATVIFGSAMAFIDGSGVNLAVPVIQREFGADTATAQWIVEAYVVILAAFTLVGGALGDSYGRRRCYAIGMVLFAAASMLCATADTAGQLIFARGLQGVGGALLIPGGLALIGGYFPPLERGRAIGTWAAFGAINGMFAPLLAGWLVESFSWRWIFYLNLPLAAIALAILFTRVPESRTPGQTKAPDWLGGILASGALALLVFALVEFPRIGPGSNLLAAAFIGALLVVLFVQHERRLERRGGAPMLPPSLFKSRVFTGVTVATLMLYTGLNGMMFFLPFYMIHVLDLSPLQAGMTFIPLSLGILVLSRRAAAFAASSPRVPLVIGCGIVALAYLQIGWSSWAGLGWLSLLPGMALVGLGMGLCIAPITNVALGAVESERAGIASGVNNAVARLSSALAIALFGLFIAAIFKPVMEDGLQQMGASQPVVEYLEQEQTKLAAARPPPTVTAAEANAIQGVINHAFKRGFEMLCLAAALLSAATAICCAVTLPRQWQSH